MTRRLLYAVLIAGAVAALSSLFSLAADAQLRTFLVRLPTGSVIRVTVDAPAGVPMSQIPGLPGIPLEEITKGLRTPTGGPTGGGGGGSTTSGGGSGGGTKTTPPPGGSGSSGTGKNTGSGGGGNNGSTNAGGSSQTGSHGGKSPSANPGSHDHGHGSNGNGGKGSRQQQHTPLRNPDGSPTSKNPTFFDALPAPSTASSVPNFVIRQFRVPIFLLPIYQAAGTQFSIRWEVLAAINEIETDYGRNLSVSTAGAVGWMQFLPSTWRTYGMDANKDGTRDPYNPVDAIFAAAKYLKAAGGDKNIRKGVFAYNHAGWYVDSVMLRAKLIAGVPGDLVGSLTGLTEGRFPVAAHARYADDMAEKAMKNRKVKAGQNAANVVTDSAGRKSIDIFADAGAPVIAVNDGVIKKIGQNKSRGRFIVLQDVYGNQYTYNHLGSVQDVYPVPKVDPNLANTKIIGANENAPKPAGPASAGRQLGGAPKSPKSALGAVTGGGGGGGVGHTVLKPRVWAHPYLGNAKKAGSLQQLYKETTTMKGFSSYSAVFAKALGLNAKNATLKPLKKGSQVVAGTLLGKVGKTVQGKGAHVNFQIRPAGKGAPEIDPKPILDGWKLLESTAIYRANGKNVLHGGASIGQILLLPKPLLEKRVLHDPRIDIYSGGRNDIRTGQIDRRVLATLAFLAESGLKPTVSCLKAGHGQMTTSGNVSEHWSGNAVDISAINGTPILGHQDKGGIAEQTVRRLMTLQGTMRPHQIISLLNLGANTLSMSDHADHIHVGFRPLFGDNKKLGKQALVVLKPGQWNNLIQRLAQLHNPVVPTKPSRFALPAGRASGAHKGE